MPAAVTVSSAELLDVVRAFERRHASLGAVTPIMAEMLVSAVGDVFEAEGPGWKRLADSTLEKRRQHGRGAKILQDTGVLAASISARHGPDFAEAATNSPYVVVHLAGGPVIPKRNPFEIDAGRVLDESIELLLNALTGLGT
jgi:phage gpG-like protein